VRHQKIFAKIAKHEPGSNPASSRRVSAVDKALPAEAKSAVKDE
jgi:hypothetical protein